MTEATWLFLDDPLQGGPAVRRWQEILRSLHYDLGAYGVDGRFGAATDASTRAFQAKEGLTVDGIVGPKTFAAAEAALGHDKEPPVDAHLTVVGGIEVWDYRDEAPHPSNYARERPWSDISGVMLHRTACILGENPKRWLPVNAHVGVTMGGRIILMHHWTDLIWHGHSPSPWTIGIELDGNPEGKLGYHWKPGGGPHDCTDAQVQACSVLLGLLTHGFITHGQIIRYVVAHRQSSKDRECDPGWQAWQKVAMPWMTITGAIPGPREGHPPTAGLTLPVGASGDTWGTGFQIPTEWDDRSPVPFWT